MRLDDKVAIITGAGSGIGRGTAILFAKEGAKVVVVDIDEKGGKETVRLIEKDNREAIFVRADVSKADDAQRIVRETVGKYGRLDVLFNNAGTTTSDWDRSLAVMLTGPYLVSNCAIPEMKKVGGGSIINTSSNVAFAAIPGPPAYCAAKTGVLGLTRAMAQNVGQDNIRVNAICPGNIRTPMSEGALREVFAPADIPDKEKAFQAALKNLANVTPLKRWGQPEDIGYAALYLASDESCLVTGAVLAVDAGMHSMLPAAVAFVQGC